MELLDQYLGSHWKGNGLEKKYTKFAKVRSDDEEFCERFADLERGNNSKRKGKL